MSPAFKSLMKISLTGCVGAFVSMLFDEPNEIAAIDSKGMADSKLFERSRTLKALKSIRSPVILLPPFVKMVTGEPMIGGTVDGDAAGGLDGVVCLGADFGRGFLLFCALAKVQTDRLRSKRSTNILLIKPYGIPSFQTMNLREPSFQSAAAPDSLRLRSILSVA